MLVSGQAAPDFENGLLASPNKWINLRGRQKNTEREFEEFKKQQQEEYNKHCEHIMLLSVGNSQSC
jgi:hypothetical protein